MMNLARNGYVLNKKYTKRPGYYLLVEGKQVIGTDNLVVVNLENCFSSDFPEGQEHDFKSELAAEKGLSKLEVEKHLSALLKKAETVSNLFNKLEEEINKNTFELLKKTSLASIDITLLMSEVVKSYSLVIEAYRLLLEIVKGSWDYCPIKMRQEFISKAQKILDLNLKKIPSISDESFIGKMEVKIIQRNNNNDEEKEALFSSEVNKNEAVSLLISSLVSYSIESYNSYVDLALRFAYSAFGAAARDKDRKEIGGIDETDYLFKLSEKNATSLKLALQEIEEGKGQSMTLDELREELGFEEEKEE